MAPMIPVRTSRTVRLGVVCLFPGSLPGDNQTRRAVTASSLRTLRIMLSLFDPQSAQNLDAAQRPGWSECDNALLDARMAPDQASSAHSGCSHRYHRLAESGQTLGVGQQHALRVAGVGHGAEFDHQKGFAVQTRVTLTEENRRTQVDAHEQGRQRTE